MEFVFHEGRETGEGVDRDLEDEEAGAETVTDEADRALVRAPATEVADLGARGAARETATRGAVARARVTEKSARKNARNAKRSATASAVACRQSKRSASAFAAQLCGWAT